MDMDKPVAEVEDYLRAREEMIENEKKQTKTNRRL